MQVTQAAFLPELLVTSGTESEQNCSMLLKMSHITWTSEPLTCNVNINDVRRRLFITALQNIAAVCATANPSVRHTLVLCLKEGMQRDAVFTIE